MLKPSLRAPHAAAVLTGPPARPPHGREPDHLLVLLAPLLVGLCHRAGYPLRLMGDQELLLSFAVLGDVCRGFEGRLQRSLGLAQVSAGGVLAPAPLLA